MFRLIRSAAPAAWRTVRLQPAIPGRVAKTVRFASSATEKQTRFERVNARRKLQRNLFNTLEATDRVTST